MSEENTVVATPEAPVSEAPTPATPPKKSVGKKKKTARKIRNAVIAVVVIAALAVGGFFLWKFLNKQEEVNSEMQTATADWGSISSTVQGQGSARAKESAAITLTQTGTVQQLFVNAGDMVTAGQPLYTIFSQAAEDEVNTRRDNLAAAQERISEAMKSMGEIQKDIADLQAKQGKLTVRAPFSGKVTEVEDFTINKRVGEGSKVCTLVNDRKLKLSLYFSYAYEHAISVGQSVDVSIPAVMQSFVGKVEKVNKVHYITPEGADHFEVIVSFENQGTLTEGMTATAALTAADGTPIYPYSGGQTEYFEVREVVTEVEGPVVSSNLLRYANVNAGDALLTLSSDALDEQIRTRRGDLETAQKGLENLQKGVDDAAKALEDAEKALGDFNAVAPIDGTITSCTLVEGAEVKSGDTVITISNNTTMVVTISVDDRNIAYVKPGLMVNLQSQWGDGGMFTGVVTKIDMSLSGDSMGSGMTNYPVTLEVDNFDGSLMEGMWLSYSFVTSQSDNCIVVPMQSVKYIGDDTSVVFIQADSKPENAVDVDIPEVMPGQVPQYPSQKDGFYAVPVTTGLTDNYNVEIKEGLTGGETIFVNYYVTQASSWG